MFVVAYCVLWFLFGVGLAFALVVSYLWGFVLVPALWGWVGGAFGSFCYMVLVYFVFVFGLG